MKTPAYLKIGTELVPVIVRPGKTGRYLTKRSTSIKPGDPLLEQESAHLAKPENKRLLKALDEGKTIAI